MQRFGLALGAGLFALMLATPTPEGFSEPAWRTAAVAVLMACWWFTEAIPMAFTGALPFILFPIFAIAPPAHVASLYMSPLIFLIMGGVVMGFAFEKWDMHRRVALAVIGRAGANPRALMFAVMLVTAILSMWLSNAATVVMMLPIAGAIILAVTGAREADELSSSQASFAAALTLAVAFGTAVGGFGTPIGSPANAVVIGVIERTVGVELSFFQWMAFGIPLIIIALPCVWFLLSYVAFRFKLEASSKERVLEAIGRPQPMGPAEHRLCIVLAIVVLGWVFRGAIQGFIPGLTDGAIALVGAIALCVIPSGDRITPSRGVRLLDWEDAKRAPWFLIFLIGGGFALADAVASTGLGDLIGNRLSYLVGVPPVVVIAFIVAIGVLLTEGASNTATASTLIPLTAALAGASGQDPMVFALAAGLAASWGFANPAGSGPNVLALATGRVRASQLARSGAIVDLLGVVLLTALCVMVVPWVLANLGHPR